LVGSSPNTGEVNGNDDGDGSTANSQQETPNNQVNDHGYANGHDSCSRLALS